jgi:hypothetical protein
MDKREIGDNLEKLITSYLQEIDPKAKQSKNSGAVNNDGDIINSYFKIECKKRNTANLVIQHKVWQKLCNQINIGSLKIPLLVLENINKEIFAVLSFKDLIQLLKKTYKKEK